MASISNYTDLCFEQFLFTVTSKCFKIQKKVYTNVLEATHSSVKFTLLRLNIEI